MIDLEDDIADVGYYLTEHFGGFSFCRVSLERFARDWMLAIG